MKTTSHWNWSSQGESSLLLASADPPVLTAEENIKPFPDEFHL